ncbi:hypothetical protein [Marasmitruncus massiliensis]|uniref:hypothetical protein n=1 Tax=Marasmitruncus massiliensis TaxID=1944642 RepID=UPI000C799B15|nr:hypothetical protein [Marasmitruncus massiliensis]
MARPKKITKAVVQKLEEGFLKGLSDQEACLFAGIAKQTLYNYQKENAEFLDRKNLLKENLKMQAKLNLAGKIETDKDITLSLWYLERKCKDEFSPKQEIEHSGSINNPLDGLTTNELRQLLKNDTDTSTETSDTA